MATYTYKLEKENEKLKQALNVLLADNAFMRSLEEEYLHELGFMAQEKNRQAKEIEAKDISLAKNISELKTLAEQVDVLTAQLEIYKADSEAERSARAELASEKDHILSDLELLQKRHQQLIDETLNSRIAKDKATVATSESHNKLESPQFNLRPNLRCPLCNSSYDDIRTLQNHVEDCVGLE